VTRESGSGLALKKILLIRNKIPAKGFYL